MESTAQKRTKVSITPQACLAKVSAIVYPWKSEPEFEIRIRIRYSNWAINMTEKMLAKTNKKFERPKEKRKFIATVRMQRRKGVCAEGCVCVCGWMSDGIERDAKYSCNVRQQQLETNKSEHGKNKILFQIVSDTQRTEQKDTDTDTLRGAQADTDTDRDRATC